MDRTLTPFAPKQLESLLQAYIKTKQRKKEDVEIKVPLATLFLNSGVKLVGRISDCDFEAKRISFVVTTPEGSVDICYMDIGQVAAITLHDLDFCPEFLEELKPL